MHHPHTSRRRAALSLCLLAAIASLPAQAATLYWDTNGTTAGIGGSGTWDTSTANFATVNTGIGAVQAWSNTTNAADIADFRGSGSNTVAVDAGGIRTAGLAFNGGNYSFSGGTFTVTSTNAFLGTASGGNVTIGNNVVIDTAAATGGQSTIFRTASASTLNIEGNISFNYTSGTPSGTKTISLQGNNANAIVNFSGSINGATGGTATSQLQISGTTGSTYYITGDNSSLTNGTSGQIVKGTVLLGHAKALGNNGIQIGVSSTNQATDVAAFLTNAALTITNNISVGGAHADAQLVVGGNTAQTSFYTGTMAGGTGAQSMRLSAAAGGRVEFSGSLTGSGTGRFIKQGAGIAALTRATGSTYTRNTEVDAGTLLLANTSGSATGTANTLTVKSGATLAGTGFSTSAVVASAADSTFSAGEMTNAGVSSVGTLNLTGGFTAADGATFDIDLSGATSDRINFGTGNVTLAGTITFNFTEVGSIELGSPFQLFIGSEGTWNGVAATFVFNGPAGYELDTSYGTGGYFWDAANHSLTVSFIPEPSTYAAFVGAGFLLFAAARRKSRVAV